MTRRVTPARDKLRSIAQLRAEYHTQHSHVVNYLLDVKKGGEPGRRKREQGKVAAEIAIRILAGEKPSDIPIATPQATRAMVNAARAAELGIEVSEETLLGIDLIRQ